MVVPSAFCRVAPILTAAYFWRRTPAPAVRAAGYVSRSSRFAPPPGAAPLTAPPRPLARPFLSRPVTRCARPAPQPPGAARPCRAAAAAGSPRLSHSGKRDRARCARPCAHHWLRCRLICIPAGRNLRAVRVNWLRRPSLPLHKMHMELHVRLPGSSMKGSSAPSQPGEWDRPLPARGSSIHLARRLPARPARSGAYQCGRGGDLCRASTQFAPSGVLGPRACGPTILPLAATRPIRAPCRTEKALCWHPSLTQPSSFISFLIHSRRGAGRQTGRPLWICCCTPT